MKILICDDDIEEGLSTKELILKFDGLCEVENMNFESIYKLLEEDKFGFNILITEILSSEEGKNGMELAERVNQKYPMCQVIYLSDRLDYAPLVYETNHCYFVLKRQMNEMLQKAIHKAKDNLNRFAGDEIISFLSGGHTVILLQREINYIERYDRFLKLHTDKKEYHCYTSLKMLSEQLTASFIRCHGSFIVNLDKISVVNNMEITLYDGTTIPLGKSFLDGFMDRYMNNALYGMNNALTEN